jgi:hypothetical protein
VEVRVLSTAPLFAALRFRFGEPNRANAVALEGSRGHMIA